MRALSLPLPRFFGEISYTIYLVHRPLLLAMTGTLATSARFVALRFALVSTGLMIATTLVSWLLYVSVERPGNRLGHRLTVNNTLGMAQSSRSASS
jgi:peptidoglycan/LPS O-acetylase OafA/YrhL